MAIVRVEVTYKRGVEDPEAITVEKNLRILGYDSIKKVNISKIYEINLGDTKRDAEDLVMEISEKILSNPVIQSYRILR